MHFPSTLPVKALQRFSKRDLQGFLEILYLAAHAKTSQDVTQTLELIKKHLPYKYVIGGVARLNRTGPDIAYVSNISYPSPWLTRYTQNGYASIDPVLLRSGQKPGLQEWTQTYEGSHLRRQQAFIEEARSFKLNHGVTISHLNPDRRLGTFFSFANEHRESRWYAPVMAHLLDPLHAVLLASLPSTDYRIRRLTMALSPQEERALKLLSCGRSNKEIAEEMALKEKTVCNYLASLYSKLHVSRRTEAIAFYFRQYEAIQRRVPTMHIG